MFQVNPLLGIHMKNQVLFSSKDKSKITMSSAAIFIWRFKGLTLLLSVFSTKTNTSVKD